MAADGNDWRLQGRNKFLKGLALTFLLVIAGCGDSPSPSFSPKPTVEVPESQPMHEVVEIVRNEGAADSTVVIEPWGMPLRLPAGHAFRVVGRAPSPGKLEVVREPNAVIVYAWPGATAKVFDGERLVDDLTSPVPSVPPGKSVREFLEVMRLRRPPSGK